MFKNVFTFRTKWGLCILLNYTGMRKKKTSHDPHLCPRTWFQSSDYQSTDLVCLSLHTQIVMNVLNKSDLYHYITDK